MPIPLGIFATAGAGGGAAGGDYELISSIITTTPGTQSFTSIPQTYKHLQIRGVGQLSTGDAYGSTLKMRVNGVSSNYATHYLIGNGSSLSSSNSSGDTYAFNYGMRLPGTNEAPGVFIVDILDYTSSKTKVIQAFNGMHGTNTRIIFLSSSATYANSSAITSLEFANYDLSAQPYGRFSLYGIKG